MRRYALILSVLKAAPLPFREVVVATGLPSRSLSTALWQLRREGHLRLIEGSPNLYEFICERPVFEHPGGLTRSDAWKQKHLWARMYEKYGSLYAEQHERKLHDRIEWAMIEEFGYLEEPIGVESIEVDARLRGCRRAHVPVDQPKPWQRTRHQLAKDEAQIRVAHHLGDRIEDARRRGGWKQTYLEAVTAGIDPEIVLQRMGVATVEDLVALDRAHGFAMLTRNRVIRHTDLPPLERAEVFHLMDSEHFETAAR